MNHMIWRTLACLSFALLGGCANTSALTDNVVQTTSDDYVLFKEDASYRIKRGIGVNWTEGVRAGIYRPELANDLGTYYRGPAGCVVQIMEEHPMGPFDGGIWIPKDLINSRPRIYYYFNHNRQTALAGGGVITDAILQGFKGDITFMPPVGMETFLDSIVVTNLPLSSN